MEAEKIMVSHCALNTQLNILIYAVGLQLFIH